MFRQGISKLAKHSPQHRHTKHEVAQLSPASIAPQSQGVSIPERFKSQDLALVNDSEEEAYEDEDEVPDDFLYLAVLLLLSFFRSLSVSLFFDVSFSPSLAFVFPPVFFASWLCS